MSRLLLVCLLVVAAGVAATVPAFGIKTVKYLGVATGKDGKLAYTEKHTVEYDNSGKVLKGVTDYLGPDERPIARLTSDFKQSLTVPEHEVENFRTGNVQGIRWVGSKIVMFSRDKEKEEKKKELPEENSRDRLLVGCQGLNYYVVNNLDHLEQLKSVPVSFLIPGELDSYDFKMKYLSEDASGIVHFEVSIQNWILRIFAPKLSVKYDRKKKRIVSYEGISNISDAKGKLQSVSITYKYDD